MFKIEDQLEAAGIAAQVKQADVTLLEVDGTPMQLGYVSNPDGAFIVVTGNADDAQPVVLRLWKPKKQPEPKAAVRADTSELVATYLARQGKVTTERSGQSGNGYSAKDWARKQKGLKVATGEEIGAERDRRSLLAITAGNFELAANLISFQYDKVIKFDIENDRIGPNGEIR